MEFWAALAWAGAGIAVTAMCVSRATYRKHLQSVSAMTVNPNPRLIKWVDELDLSLVVSPNLRPSGSNADAWVTVGTAGPVARNGVDKPMMVGEDGPICVLRMAHKNTLIELRAVSAVDIEELMQLSAKEPRTPAEDQRLLAIQSRYSDELKDAILSLMGAGPLEEEQPADVQPVAKAVVDAFVTKRILDI